MSDNTITLEILCYAYNITLNKKMRRIIPLVIFSMMCTMVSSQTKDQKWVLGVSGSLISFGDAGAASMIKERFNFQFPKLNLTRYLFKGFILEGGVTLSSIDRVDGLYTNAFNYISLDGAIRYDFNRSEENLIPYIAFGSSFIGVPSTIPYSEDTATINSSIGMNFWISPQWGLNAQGTYKFFNPDFRSMRSHHQLSVGFIYSFKPRVMVFRLWDGKRR